MIINKTLKIFLNDEMVEKNFKLPFKNSPALPFNYFVKNILAVKALYSKERFERKQNSQRRSVLLTKPNQQPEGLKQFHLFSA